MAISSEPKIKPNLYAGQITFKLPERLPPWPKKNQGETPIDPTDGMFAKLVCSPPLGQATIVAPGQSVTFTVLLETDSGSEKEWQVALWHGLGNSDEKWSSIDFKATSGDVDIVCFDSAHHLFLNSNTS
jgi:hypothetical protein